MTLLLFIDCSDHHNRPCPWGEVCCGHGPEKCMCPYPRIRNKKGECMGKYISLCKSCNEQA